MDRLRKTHEQLCVIVWGPQWCWDYANLSSFHCHTSKPGCYQEPCLCSWSYGCWGLCWSQRSALPPKVTQKLGIGPQPVPLLVTGNLCHLESHPDFSGQCFLLEPGCFPCMSYFQGQCLRPWSSYSWGLRWGLWPVSAQETIGAIVWSKQRAMLNWPHPSLAHGKLAFLSLDTATRKLAMMLTG